MRSTLIISTLNEIGGVEALYPRIPFEAVDECIVLDGGSTDGTVEFFWAKGIRVVSNVKKGDIFRVGAQEAAGEYLVFFAPDGNEDPEDIPRLLALLEEGYDMAIASRFMPGARNEEDGNRLPLRAWANRFFTFLVWAFWGGKITDTINGFRSVRKAKLLEMKTDASGFDIEFQISIRALKLGHAVLEIPTNEGDRIGGRSKAHSIPTGLRMLRCLCREVLISKKF